MRSSKPLEQGRREAGQHPIIASVQKRSLTQRIEKDILELRFKVAKNTFSQSGNPAMPLAGDVLGVFPENQATYIDRLQEYLIPATSDQCFLKGRHETDEGSWYSIKEALKYVSLNPVKIELLEHLKEILEKCDTLPSHLEAGKKTLDHLIQLHESNPNECRAILKHQHLTDVLEMLPKLLTLQEVCIIQGGNYRRVYTIAGIDRDEYGNPQYIRILVASDVFYEVPEKGFHPGRRHEGCCSNYLKSLPAYPHAKAEIFVQRRQFGAPEKQRIYLPQQHFVLDINFRHKLDIPLLLIAAGSGVAGLRSILEERANWQKQGHKVGRVTLLFGLQQRNIDFLYEQDWKQFQDLGILDKILLAESRPHKGQKKYVQDLLLDSQCQEAIQEIASEKRCMIICGDWKMGRSILQGYLPLVLPFLRPEILPAMLRHRLIVPSKEAIQELFILGRQQILSLQFKGFIRSSTSGSRYCKVKQSEEEAFQNFFEEAGWAGIRKALNIKLDPVTF